MAAAGLPAATARCNQIPSLNTATALTSCCACCLRLSAAAALSSTSAAFCCVTWSIWLTASPTCDTPWLCSLLALLVLRRGALIHEAYFNGFERTSIGTSFSVAKSIVSALVGIALAEGHIASLDDPLTRYLPELAATDARFSNVTLRHLLLMRSGIAFDEGYRSPLSDAARFYLSRDLAARVRALKIEGAPDRIQAYRSGDTQFLGMVLARATGLSLAKYAESRLWQPMGAEFDASWSLDSADAGTAKAFCLSLIHI